jgi:5'-nucleotidase
MHGGIDMKILLSNDDGITAPGLALLEEIAKKFTDDVTVVAPDSDMSGAGHSLTLRSPLRLAQHDKTHFSVNGTPTDSVVMAIRHVMPEKPDFLFSGVNYDSNMAEDITYSGTVAAAMEARLLGVPSIALSQKVGEAGKIDQNIVRTFAPKVLKAILDGFEFPEGIFLNINFPSVSVDDVKGVKITAQGTRTIEDRVIQSVDPRGKPYFWIGAADYRKNENHRDVETDLWAVQSGYISVTPISLDMTDRTSFGALNKLFA